eukprot:CAMPEP_0178793636 /NCGR_PEP_ID=MMETSP0745-20121128/9167_1 /TAXON_ID=913974 /ORGANISM="Nitzschia punctata, Strain CCMP561" /LENGTH=211 /DNA_ID=CAMNT_0020451913 /DNA_START=8 /DNA_END=643 /DNA_ORIENTATION=-
MPMLVKEWRQNPKQAPECVRNNPPGKDSLSPSDCERIIVGLLVNDLILPQCRYTAYDTVVYLEATPKARSFINSDKARMSLPLPKKGAKSKRKSNAPTPTSEDGWVETKTASKRKRSSSAAAAVKKQKSSTTKPASKGTKRGKKNRDAGNQQQNEVIELMDDSDGESVSSVEEIAVKRAFLRNPRPLLVPPVASAATTNPTDDDSEFEFEG